MEPMYFKGPRCQLFGVYHEPRRSVKRPLGVVVCEPWGHEQIRAHRTTVALARRLAELGAMVFRFNYDGCGDSSDSNIDCGIKGYVEDAQAALGELKAGTGVDQTCLISLRLGANIAADCAQKTDGIVGLV